MGNLKIINSNKSLAIDSREVAQMVGKRHSDLLRDIETYNQYLENAKLRSQDFFIKDSYKTERNNKSYKCYQVTKKGCEFIAHKLTGEKGVLFTAKYINRFHDMEDSLKQVATILTEEQKLQLAIFQAKTSNDAAVAAANLDRYRQLQLEEKQKEIEYKNEVIKGATEDIDVYTKRIILNRVVRYKKANFRQRWDELYKAFKETYSIDLKARCDGYNMKQERAKDKLSIVKYAEKFGYIHDLYKVALKLYETDINKILENLKKIA